MNRQVNTAAVMASPMQTEPAARLSMVAPSNQKADENTPARKASAVNTARMWGL